MKPLCQSDVCTPVFIAPLLIIAKKEKQRKGPSTDEQIKNMQHICTMEYYLAIKKNGIPPFAAMWMELEIVKLIKRSQAQKSGTCHMISLISGI
jgi:hypothetical protein